MFLLCFLITFFFSTTPVLAKSDFNVNQNIQYQLDENGNAQVLQEIELTNNLSQIYPTEYQAIISSQNIENILATDNLGSIIQNIQQLNDQTIINLKFNSQNLGKNQKTNFKLHYKIPNLATQKGNSWEINIPENKNNLDNSVFTTSLFIPNTYGSLSFTSISPQTIVSLNNQTEIYFKQLDNKNQKIYLIFGNYQLFDFKFKYLLENKSNQNKTFDITLPPETDNQKIKYRYIEPKPLNIKTDVDGNYLASYQLSPSQKIDINIDGQVKIIHSNQHKSVINFKDYLKKDTFWEIDDQNLISIAANLSTPKDIYKYVVDSLNYKYKNIDYSFRQGALYSINNPNDALCTEFTDLFITLSRIKGIPAREVQGYAYSNNVKIKPININTDILHAWPQYYDSKKEAWISIDPTWGKTTNGIDFFDDLDFNHFAFVFHGLSSLNPPPAGAYKNNQNIKTVNVEFAKTELKNDQIPLKITPLSTKIYQSPTIKIENPNLQTITQLKINIKKLGINTQVNLLPPLSSIEIPIQNHSFLNFILPLHYKINIDLEYNSNTVNLKIANPQFWFKLIIFLGLIITLIGFGGIIFNRRKKTK